MPDQMYFKNVLRVQFAGTQGLFRFSAAAPADQWMIEKLLELRGCRAQVVHIQDFGNPFLPAIRAFSPNQEVRWRNAQQDPGLKQIALGRVLQDIQLLLGQVALHVKPRADANRDEVNIETRRRRRVVPDLDRVFVVNLQRRGVSGVERLFELSRPGLAATGTPAADALRRIYGPGADRLVAAAIAISAFGFLDLTLLAQTRIYFAMGRDGVFLPGLARLHPKFQTPALAILHNPDAPDPPSTPAALKMFCRIARDMGMRTEIVGRDAIERLPEFDALFIRDTTHVNHYTYQFARRAVAEGLVVIDDPDSIVRATNKVFLYELLSRHQIPMPRSLICSPSHMMKAEPVVRVRTVIILKPQPGW